MSFALDVNSLLYASDTSSPHFERARSFLNVRDPLL
jgi:predicted nucleic acid-binding protein